jgi:hypothetical protein
MASFIPIARAGVFGTLPSFLRIGESLLVDKAEGIRGPVNHKRSPRRYVRFQPYLRLLIQSFSLLHPPLFLMCFLELATAPVNLSKLRLCAFVRALGKAVARRAMLLVEGGMKELLRISLLYLRCQLGFAWSHR